MTVRMGNNKVFPIFLTVAHYLNFFLNKTSIPLLLFIVHITYHIIPYHILISYWKALPYLKNIVSCVQIYKKWRALLLALLTLYGAHNHSSFPIGHRDHFTHQLKKPYRKYPRIKPYCWLCGQSNSVLPLIYPLFYSVQIIKFNHSDRSLENLWQNYLLFMHRKPNMDVSGWNLLIVCK